MKTKPIHRNTLPVSDKVFKAVYDSPQSLPGKHKWLTADADVRQVEDLLGMSPRTLGCRSGSEAIGTAVRSAGRKSRGSISSRRR